MAVKARPFQAKYAGQRRQEIFRARFELGLPYEEIARRAREGELIFSDPFEISWQYVGNLCRGEEKRRAGRFDSRLADMPHRDAVEELRRGAIGVAEDILVDLRATSQKHPERADPKRLQEAIKAIALASSIPARHEPAPAAKLPKIHAPRVVTEPSTSGTGKLPSRTGALMRAHRAQLAREAAPEPPLDAA
jgi:hypothetical protein